MALDTTSTAAPDTTAAAPAVSDTPATPASAPSGTQAITGHVDAAPAGGPETPTTPAAAQAAAIAEIEALLDGQPMKLREDLQLPWKRGEETGTISLREAINGYQREADYTRKMQAFSQDRRAFESQRLDIETTRRQIEAERTAVQREMQRHLDALTSGDETKLQRYNRHLEMLSGDEDYRKTYEKALKAEAYEAREGLHSELSQQQYVQAVQADIADAVTRFSQELALHPEQVDRVLARYETLVQQQGESALTERTLRKLFEEEASYAQTVSTPLKTELDALKAEIERLKSGSQADAHNSRVRSAVTKARAAGVAATPASGSAPALGASTATPARSLSREEKHRAFMRGA